MKLEPQWELNITENFYLIEKFNLLASSGGDENSSLVEN